MQVAVTVGFIMVAGAGAMLGALPLASADHVALTVQVVDADGAPAEALVQVLDRDAGGALLAELDTEAGAATFALDPGNYTVLAVADDPAAPALGFNASVALAEDALTAGVALAEALAQIEVDLANAADEPVDGLVTVDAGAYDVQASRLDGGEARLFYVPAGSWVQVSAMNATWGSNAMRLFAHAATSDGTTLSAHRASMYLLDASGLGTTTVQGQLRHAHDDDAFGQPAVPQDLLDPRVLLFVRTGSGSRLVAAGPVADDGTFALAAPNLWNRTEPGPAPNGDLAALDGFRWAPAGSEFLDSGALQAGGAEASPRIQPAAVVHGALPGGPAEARDVAVSLVPEGVRWMTSGSGLWGHRLHLGHPDRGLSAFAQVNALDALLDGGFLGLDRSYWALVPISTAVASRAQLFAALVDPAEHNVTHASDVVTVALGTSPGEDIDQDLALGPSAAHLVLRPGTLPEGANTRDFVAELYDADRAFLGYVPAAIDGDDPRIVAHLAREAYHVRALHFANVDAGARMVDEALQPDLAAGDAAATATLGDGKLLQVRAHTPDDIAAMFVDEDMFLAVPQSPLDVDWRAGSGAPWWHGRSTQLGLTRGAPQPSFLTLVPDAVEAADTRVNLSYAGEGGPYDAKANLQPVEDPDGDLVVRELLLPGGTSTCALTGSVLRGDTYAGIGGARVDAMLFGAPGFDVREGFRILSEGIRAATATSAGSGGFSLALPDLQAGGESFRYAVRLAADDPATDGTDWLATDEHALTNFFRGFTCADGDASADVLSLGAVYLQPAGDLELRGLDGAGDPVNVRGLVYRLVEDARGVTLPFADMREVWAQGSEPTDLTMVAGEGAQLYLSSSEDGPPEGVRAEPLVHLNASLGVAQGDATILDALMEPAGRLLVDVGSPFCPPDMECPLFEPVLLVDPATGDIHGGQRLQYTWNQDGPDGPGVLHAPPGTWDLMVAGDPWAGTLTLDNGGAGFTVTAGQNTSVDPGASWPAFWDPQVEMPTSVEPGDAFAVRMRAMDFGGFGPGSGPQQLTDEDVPDVLVAEWDEDGTTLLRELGSLAYNATGGEWEGSFTASPDAGKYTIAVRALRSVFDPEDAVVGAAEKVRTVTLTASNVSAFLRFDLFRFAATDVAKPLLMVRNADGGDCAGVAYDVAWEVLNGFDGQTVATGTGTTDTSGALRVSLDMGALGLRPGFYRMVADVNHDDCGFGYAEAFFEVFLFNLEVRTDKVRYTPNLDDEVVLNITLRGRDGSVLSAPSGNATITVQAFGRSGAITLDGTSSLNITQGNPIQAVMRFNLTGNLSTAEHAFFDVEVVGGPFRERGGTPVEIAALDVFVEGRHDLAPGAPMDWRVVVLAPGEAGMQPVPGAQVCLRLERVAPSFADLGNQGCADPTDGNGVATLDLPAPTEPGQYHAMISAQSSAGSATRHDGFQVVRGDIRVHLERFTYAPCDTADVRVEVFDRDTGRLDRATARDVTATLTDPTGASYATAAATTANGTATVQLLLGSGDPCAGVSPGFYSLILEITDGDTTDTVFQFLAVSTLELDIDAAEPVEVEIPGTLDFDVTVTSSGDAVTDAQLDCKLFASDGFGRALVVTNNGDGTHSVTHDVPMGTPPGFFHVGCFALRDAGGAGPPDVGDAGFGGKFRGVDIRLATDRRNYAPGDDVRAQADVRLPDGSAATGLTAVFRLLDPRAGTILDTANATVTAGAAAGTLTLPSTPGSYAVRVRVYDGTDLLGERLLGLGANDLEVTFQISPRQAGPGDDLRFVLHAEDRDGDREDLTDGGSAGRVFLDIFCPAAGERMQVDFQDFASGDPTAWDAAELEFNFTVTVPADAPRGLCTLAAVVEDENGVPSMDAQDLVLTNLALEVELDQATAQAPGFWNLTGGATVGASLTLADRAGNPLDGTVTYTVVKVGTGAVAALGQAGAIADGAHATTFDLASQGPGTYRIRALATATLDGVEERAERELMAVVGSAVTMALDPSPADADEEVTVTLAGLDGDVTLEVIDPDGAIAATVVLPAGEDSGTFTPDDAGMWLVVVRTTAGGVLATGAVEVG